MILFRQRALSVPVYRATPVSSSPDPITIVLASLGLPAVSLSPARTTPHTCCTNQRHIDTNLG